MQKSLWKTELKIVFMPINKKYDFSIPGLQMFDLQSHQDQRGTFLKVYSSQLGIQFSKIDAYEIFYNVSKKNSLRGMHFQSPPFSSDKLVHCLSGSVLDVILDLRKNSPSFKKHLSFSMTSANPQVLLIPKGCAHGFLSMQDHSTVLYFQNSNYHEQNDVGIRWNSFGFDWPDKGQFLISDRDQILPPLGLYDSPFNI